MDTLELIKLRHSVRQYTDKPIEPEKRNVLNQLIDDINTTQLLNIQILYDEPNCFNSAMAHYGKFSGVTNYISLVGKKSNTLDERLGYYGEKIVLKAQELGLNTCWVAMTHGKSNANVKSDEKEVCIISIGYGSTNGVAHQSKPIERLCNYSSSLPDWYIKGVQSASYAPTAMNQQKFFFELKDGNTVVATHGIGFYTKLDLGIAKYHFEAVTGKKVQ